MADEVTPNPVPATPLPMQAPAPQPRRRSFAGPIVLILLGIVFLLGNMHLLTWRSIGEWFANYWPVLLIIWGVIKMVEYYHARSEGYTPSGIGFGSCVLVFFIVVFGLGATGIERIKGHMPNVIDVDDENIPVFWGNKYEYTQTLDQELPASGMVKFAVERGSIKVLPSPDNKVHISVHKTVVAGSQSEGDEIDRKTQPRITAPPAPPAPPGSKRAPPAPPSGSAKGMSDSVRADVGRAQQDIVQAQKEIARAQKEAERARIEAEEAVRDAMSVDATIQGDTYAKIDMEVQVPRKASLDLSTQRGEIEVAGREGDVKISNIHGSVRVEDVKGSVNIYQRGGDFTARNIAGDVTLEGRLNDTNISDVSGSVALRGDYYGDMNLSNIGKSVRFSSSRTELEMGKLTGDMKMGGGDLRVNDLAGPFRIDTKSKDIHLDGVTGDVVVTNSNASVEIHAGKLPLGNIQVTNRHGGIQLYVPDKAAFQLEARARRGEISSDFEGVRIEGDRRDNKATGSVGTGGSHVQLSTENADIEIHKGG